MKNFTEAHSAAIVLLINEFSDKACPVTKMLYDLGDHLTSASFDVKHVNCRTKYRVGGTRSFRIVSLFGLHLSLPWIFIFYKSYSLFFQKQVAVVTTTLPPFIHWNSLVWGKVFNIPVLVWYQDAHPEIERQILLGKANSAPTSFKARISGIIASILRFLDTQIMQLTKKAVCLDQAMVDLLRRIVGQSSIPFKVASPWITYLEPAKPLRGRVCDITELKLLYAGNYGFAHDLSHLADVLKQDGLRLKLSITFVGMNEAAKERLRLLFEDTKAQILFFPRFKSVDELLNFFEEHHLGIVSLRDSFTGIACPSKAYSYLSQGMPILYIGPEKTLSDSLVSEGWGIDLNDFKNIILNESANLDLPRHLNTLVSPRKEALQTLRNEVGELFV